MIVGMFPACKNDTLNMVFNGGDMPDNKASKFKKELESILDGDADLIDQIMRSLDKERIIHYQSNDEIALFSTAGRVLYCLMDDPTMTQRALAVYLGLSETMIEKTLKSLITEGLITKTKLNRKNVYTFDKNLIINHPDIQRIPSILKRINKMSRPSHDVGDDAPF